MKQLLSTRVLAVLAVLVWLAACGLAFWTESAYDGALGLNPVYYLVWGGLTLLIGLASNRYADENRPARTPRWVGVLLLLAAVLLAFAVLRLENLISLLYSPSFWWFGLLALIGIAVWLYAQLPFRRPRPPRQPRSSLWNASVCILAFFAPLLVVLPVYLLLVHPVPVAQITPVGEATGSRFIGRITGDRSESPLGLYFFADDNGQDTYYDILTGQPVDYGTS